MQGVSFVAARQNRSPHRWERAAHEERLDGGDHLWIRRLLDALFLTLGNFASFNYSTRFVCKLLIIRYEKTAIALRVEYMWNRITQLWTFGGLPLQR